MNAPINDLVPSSLKRIGADSRDAYLISIHVRDLLNLRRLPARLSARQAAAFLNCGDHDIPVLVSHGMLTPLGHPPANAQKYFSPVEVLELAGDSKKMGRICDILYKHWQIKNASRSSQD
jgi:hypothetical protein